MLESVNMMYVITTVGGLLILAALMPLMRKPFEVTYGENRHNQIEETMEYAREYNKRMNEVRQVAAKRQRYDHFMKDAKAATVIRRKGK